MAWVNIWCCSTFRHSNCAAAQCSHTCCVRILVLFLSSGSLSIIAIIAITVTIIAIIAITVTIIAVVNIITIITIGTITVTIIAIIAIISIIAIIAIVTIITIATIISVITGAIFTQGKVPKTSVFADLLWHALLQLLWCSPCQTRHLHR